MDTVTPGVRSWMMSRIRSKDTEPELIVRRYLHAAGLRYRLHDHHLAGRPDLVFASRGVCVFVHGCFWHGCPKCPDGQRCAKSNRAYWKRKIERNRRRGEASIRALRRNGWSVFVIWECETGDSGKLVALKRSILRTPVRSRQPR